MQLLAKDVTYSCEGRIDGGLDDKDVLLSNPMAHATRGRRIRSDPGRRKETLRPQTFKLPWPIPGGLRKVRAGRHKIYFAANSMGGGFKGGKGKLRRHEITPVRETVYRNLGTPATGLETPRRTMRRAVASLSTRAGVVARKVGFIVYMGEYHPCGSTEQCENEAATSVRRTEGVLHLAGGYCKE